MEKNENYNEDSSLSNNLISILIKQLQFWFNSNQNHFSNFTTLSLAGPRRDNLQSHVCTKKNFSSKKVLKSFNNLHLISTWKQVAYELIVPILVDSKQFLKYESVFIHNNVFIHIFLI